MIIISKGWGGIVVVMFPFVIGMVVWGLFPSIGDHLSFGSIKVVSSRF